MDGAKKIRVTYQSVDGYRQTRTFKTLAGARRFAQTWIGPTPDIGWGYAISADGIGKITVDGCGLEELFRAGGRD